MDQGTWAWCWIKFEAQRLLDSHAKVRDKCWDMIFSKWNVWKHVFLCFGKALNTWYFPLLSWSIFLPLYKHTTFRHKGHEELAGEWGFKEKNFQFFLTFGFQILSHFKAIQGFQSLPEGLRIPFHFSLKSITPQNTPFIIADLVSLVSFRFLCSCSFNYC